MSASITISAASLAADGLTLTYTLGGGTGTGFSPASGATGILAKLGGQYLAHFAHTISGTTGTITLRAKRLSGDTVTLDANAGGNITDSGANTLVATAGVAVTNNSAVAGSAVTALIGDAALLFGGSWPAGSLGGRAIISPASGSELRFQFSGSQVEFLTYANSGSGDSMKYRIDGGSEQTLTFADNQTGGTGGTTAWQWIAIAGLTEGTHTLSLYVASTANFHGLDGTGTNPTIRVTGASPAITRESAYQGTAYNFSGAVMPAGVIANAQCRLYTGTSTQGYSDYLSFSWQNAAVRFRAKISALKIWGLSLGQDWAVTIDGVEQTIRHLGSSNAPEVDNGTGQSWGWKTYTNLLAGLDDTAYHTYEIQAVSQFAPGNTGQFWVQLLFVHDPANGAGGLDTTYTPTAFPAAGLVSYGDSITQQTMGTGTDGANSVVDSRIAYGWKVAAALGLQGINRGISGTTEHNFAGSGTDSYTARSGEVRAHADLSTALSGVSSVYAFVDCYGTNDLGTLPDLGSTPGGATALTQASFQASVYNVWADVLATFPTARIVICGIAERSEANNSGNATYGLSSASNQNRLTLNTARQAAAAQLQVAFPSANVTYLSLDGVLAINPGAFDTSSADTVDGLHWNDAGHTKVADAIEAELAPANAAPDAPTVTVTPFTLGRMTVGLTGSAFTDADGGDTHAATQWQVTTAADTGYAAPVFDPGDDATNLAARTVTGLTPATAYRARARYKDSAGNYSAYSASATFTTTFQPTLTVGTPTATGVTLTGSAFPMPGVTHAASRWQVAPTADVFYSTPAVDTGDDATHLTSYAATGLTASTAYRAKVTYKDSAGEYSSQSDDVTFTTADAPATLTAGTASFVSSGPAGIGVAATAPTGGSGSLSYQWERNADGGSYVDVSGATNLTLTDATATTADILYGYRCKQTKGAGTVTTNAVTAQVYAGGDIGTGGGTVLGTITRQFGHLDFYKGDAFERALVYEADEDWPATITTAHLYAVPTDETLDGDSDAESLTGIECTVDVTTGDDRQVTVALTPDNTATLTAGRRGIAGYTWWVIANKAGEDKTLRSGTMTVRSRPVA